MNNFILSDIKKINDGFSSYTFIIGLFLLPSAFTLAGVFLLISIIKSTLTNRKYFLSDRWNKFFIIGSLLMLISCLIHTFFNNHLLKYNLNSSLTWIGLANWIPLFWCYWGFKPFLNNPIKRKISSLALFCGTFPVLVTGLGQYFLGWHGPFEFLNGFIVWYQRPIENLSGLTGLFNNANYMGTWLNVIWPIGLACLIESNKNIVNNLSKYIFTFGISISTIFTFSRAAWFGIFLGTLLMYGKKIYKYIIFLLIFISLIITSTITPILGIRIQTILQSLIPQSIWMKFSDFQYSRIDIWKSGIVSAYKNPIFGSGGASFPDIFKSETGLWKGHVHNLPLELIISYGIPAGIFVMFPIVIITMLSLKKCFLNSRLISTFDKSWVTSLVVLLTSQMVDIQYFDGRVSIIFWLLISGSSNIIDKKENPQT